MLILYSIGKKNHISLDLMLRPGGLLICCSILLGMAHSFTRDIRTSIQSITIMTDQDRYVSKDLNVDIGLQSVEDAVEDFCKYKNYYCHDKNEIILRSTSSFLAG